ncbi:MAG TPA: phage tail tube protein [Kiloniellales bacterium]
MTSLAIHSEGTLFQRGDGASPEVFATIGEVTDFDGPSGQAAVIDVTHFQSTFKDKLIGLPDEGQFTLSGNYVKSSTAQAGLKTDRTNRTLRNFKLTLTDSPATVLTFAAFVLSFSISAAVDDKVPFSVTLEISGPVTWA